MKTIFTLAILILALTCNSQCTMSLDYGTTNTVLDWKPGTVLKYTSDMKMVYKSNNVVIDTFDLENLVMSYDCMTNETNEIQKTNISERFKISPNPNNGTFELSISDFDEMLITDITGRVIEYEIYNNKVILWEQNPGLYICSVKKNSTISNQKFIVQ